MKQLFPKTQTNFVFFCLLNIFATGFILNWHQFLGYSVPGCTARCRVQYIQRCIPRHSRVHCTYIQCPFYDLTVRCMCAYVAVPARHITDALITCGCPLFTVPLSASRVHAANSRSCRLYSGLPVSIYFTSCIHTPGFAYIKILYLHTRSTIYNLNTLYSTSTLKSLYLNIRITLNSRVLMMFNVAKVS